MLFSIYITIIYNLINQIIQDTLISFLHIPVAKPSFALNFYIKESALIKNIPYPGVEPRPPNLKTDILPLD